MNPDDPIQRVVNGRYRVMATERVELLAVAADAFDTLTATPVVLTAVRKAKVADFPSGYTLDRIRADMEASQRLTHPDVLHCFDWFEEDDFLYLVSEYSGLAPVTHLPLATNAAKVAAVVRAIHKLVYVVEFHHNNQIFGCAIRERHVRMGADGETRIDSVVASRLSYVADCGAAAAKRLLEDDAEARATDLRLAGDVVRTLLHRLPDAPPAPADAEAARFAELLRTVVPPLWGVAERLLQTGQGGFDAIEQASDALRQVEDALRTCLYEPPRALPTQSERRRFAAGEIIFREGDPAREEAFIIERGLVQISKTDPEGREIHLDVSRPGDIVGEMALIDDKPRMAGARAIEPTDLVVISGAEFRANVARMDNVARRLITVLANRLRFQAGEVARLKALIGVCK